MKKFLLSLVAVLALTVNATAQNINDLIGSYTGDLYIQLIDPINEETEALPNQSIKIEAGEGQSINFALYNFAFAGMNLGDIILNNVGVKSEGNLVKFNDEKPVDLSFLQGAILANAKINPATSYIEGDKIVANLDVMWTNTDTPTPIYVRFVGVKKAEPLNINDLIGDYNGDLFIQLIDPINDETEALPNQSIKIEAGEGQSINFALYNFAFAGMNLGDIILNNVGVKSEGNLVKFNDEKPVDLSFLQGAILANAKINPATSYIEGDKIVANLDVMWTNTDTPTPIYVRFVGAKKAATGIDNVEIQQAAKEGIYTLNGVRVNANSLKDLPSGVYIVNGKKWLSK